MIKYTRVNDKDIGVDIKPIQLGGGRFTLAINIESEDKQVDLEHLGHALQYAFTDFTTVLPPHMLGKGHSMVATYLSPEFRTSLRSDGGVSTKHGVTIYFDLHDKKQ